MIQQQLLPLQQQLRLLQQQQLSLRVKKVLRGGHIVFMVTYDGKDVTAKIKELGFLAICNKKLKVSKAFLGRLLDPLV